MFFFIKNLLKPNTDVVTSAHVQSFQPDDQLISERDKMSDAVLLFQYTMAQGPFLPMVPPPPALPPENPPLPEGTSDEESEYESGDDEDKERSGKWPYWRNILI